MKSLTNFAPNDFKVSTQCGHGTTRCVQVAHKNGVIAVGDTKNPKQPYLCFDQDEWAAFTAGIKNGEFDF